MKGILQTALYTLAAATVATAQLPVVPTDLKTITTPQGVNIRYKEPQICETTPGVKSYSGFIDVDDDNHLFFWFFESRRDPGNDPITLWLNGGPGGDSMNGVFEELGPCFLNEDLSTRLNPNSWNEVSNMLFLSQPAGVGFSYGSKTTDPLEQIVMGGMTEVLEGRFATADWAKTNSTESAAVTAWNAIQAFCAGLPQLAPDVRSSTFNLATESYGGHRGTGFINHFWKQNKLIANGTITGSELNIDSLIIINGLIDTRTQAASYPRFARNNTHGVEVNDSVADYMEFSLTMDVNGCHAMIDACEAYYAVDNGTTASGRLACSEASTACRRGSELPYVVYSGIEDVYDVRNKTEFPNPAPVTPTYLNQAKIQRALGVDTNYTTKDNLQVLAAFWATGDYINPKIMRQFEELLDDAPVRIALIYGDSDFICSWYGGENVSLTANYSGAEDFRKAGYVPLMVDGVRYGDTREYGNFSFTRVFDAGHMVPWWQPEASLAMFNRTLNGRDIATGNVKIRDGYGTVGQPESTYSQKLNRGGPSKKKRSAQNSVKFRSRLSG